MQQLVDAIRQLEKRNSLRVESWLSVLLACLLACIGAFIFWRMWIMFPENESKAIVAIESSAHRHAQDIYVPFMILSAGCFVILVVTILAMWWQRNRSAQERCRHRLTELVINLISEHQDEASRNISSWLHDGVGHGLVMLKMQVECFKKKGVLSEKNSEDLIVAIKALLDETRNMASMVYPKAITQLGLKAALEQLFLNFEQVSSVCVQRQIDECIDGRCSPMAELLIFRIAQESLTNIAKHTKATHVFARIVIREGGIESQIRNNGIHELSAGTTEQGIGLMVMRERAKRISGVVETSRVFDQEWLHQIAFTFPAGKKESFSTC